MHDASDMGPANMQRFNIMDKLCGGGGILETRVQTTFGGIRFNHPSILYLQLFIHLCCNWVHQECPEPKKIDHGKNTF